MGKINYLLSPSRFGDFALVWESSLSQAKILRVFLPTAEQALKGRIRTQYSQAQEISDPDLDAVALDIRRYLDGEEVFLDLAWLAWECCTEFQARVLRAESGIPRGWVSTYGRIANNLGIPGGARAVGGALARNPFPIFIPCHRAVRSTGALGGYQGGLAMKKNLLIMEGVAFSSSHTVSLEKIYY